MKKRDRNDPMKPMRINIFLFFTLSDIFPHRMSATTEDRDERDDAIPTKTTFCLKYSEMKRGIIGVRSPADMFEKMYARYHKRHLLL
jgi:hypothetical protein